MSWNVISYWKLPKVQMLFTKLIPKLHSKEIVLSHIWNVSNWTSYNVQNIYIYIYIVIHRKTVLLYLYVYKVEGLLYIYLGEKERKKERKIDRYWVRGKQRKREREWLYSNWERKMNTLLCQIHSLNLEQKCLCNFLISYPKERHKERERSV